MLSLVPRIPIVGVLMLLATLQASVIVPRAMTVPSTGLATQTMSANTLCAMMIRIVLPALRDASQLKSVHTVWPHAVLQAHIKITNALAHYPCAYQTPLAAQLELVTHARTL